MKLKRLITINNLLLVMAVFLFSSCGGGGQQGQRGPGQQQAQPYPVLELQPRSIILTNSYPTTLEGAQTVEIRPRVQGYITEMRVDEGDVVNKGQVLFELNSEQYEQEIRSAQADVEAAKASISTAEDEVKRLRSLVEKDIISDYRLQSAKNALKTQKAALAQAQASLENARINLGYTNVKSPANGIIGTIPYRIGSLVSSSITEPLTMVSDVSEVYAYFSLSERELLSMTQSVAKEGGNSTLQQRVAEMPKVNLMLADGTIYDRKGTIKLASGLINSETGSASFRAVFPNPNQLLRSGSTGNIQIPLDLDSVIVIPKKATFEVQDKQFVYTVTDSSKVKSTPIKTRTLSTQKLYVVQEGLSTNDRIVTAGMTGLQDSTSIKPQPVNADSLYQALTIEDQQENQQRYQ